MNKKYTAILLALAVCFVTVSGAYAFMGFGHGNELAKEALENEDYAAWVESIESRPKITDIITEDNFSQYVTLHKLRQEGDFETAQTIAEELGIDRFGTPKHSEGNSRFGIKGQRRAMRKNRVNS